MFIKNTLQKKIGFILFLMLILMGFKISYALDNNNKTNSKIPVFASIQPISYLIKQIGSDHVDVQTLISPSQSPHTFEPSPRQIAKLGNIHIFFKTGFPFENRILEKIRDNHKKLIISDISKGVKFRSMEDHDHIGKDPHIWLGISQIKTIVKNITETLTKVNPKNSHDYRKNLTNFLGKLDSLNRKISRKLTPYKGRKVFMFHPAFGYFTDSFNIIQEAVEINGKSPAPKQLAYLIKEALKDNVTVIFVQPQFDAKGANVIANAIHGKVVPMNPLAKDLLENLYDMGNKIAKVLDNQKKSVKKNIK